jgi:hypothetical protein
MMSIQWKRANEQELKLLRSIFLLVGSEPKLLTFLFDPKAPRIRKRAGILRDEAWAFRADEQLQIRAALDIWCGAGHVQLWELIETWDAKSWVRFIRAIGELRNLPSGTIC